MTLTPNDGLAVQTTPVSLLDVLPTILDWHQLELPNYLILKKNVSYTGTSLLKLPNNPNRLVFGSHNFHEITMSYPMRYVRSRRYVCSTTLDVPKLTLTMTVYKLRCRNGYRRVLLTFSSYFESLLTCSYYADRR